MRLLSRRFLGWLGIAVALALIVTLAIAWPHVQRFTTGLPPDQFHRELDPTLTKDYPETLGIAHNAGNRLETIKTALSHGADVIEVDVISVRGTLVGGRDQPWPWLSNHLFRGPTLTEVWKAAASAEVIKLDLKQDDAKYVDAVADFLEPRASSRQVMVASRDAQSLMMLHERVPGATMVFSMGFPDAVDHLRSDAALRSAIGAVSVFQGLVTADLVTWLHEQHLLVLAWTVNDVHRLNALIRDGVDGVTTANLAILHALG
jgi:glycerophosphoryl diester phosphodiesterase